MYHHGRRTTGASTWLHMSFLAIPKVFFWYNAYVNDSFDARYDVLYVSECYALAMSAGHCAEDIRGMLFADRRLDAAIKTKQPRLQAESMEACVVSPLGHVATSPRLRS